MLTQLRSLFLSRFLLPGLGLSLRTGLSLALSLSVAVIVGDNSSVVGLVDVISDLIGFQNVSPEPERRVLFIAFFYGNDVYVGLGCLRIGFFISQSIFCYGEACCQSVVSVQYHISGLINHAGYLCCLQLYDIQVVRIPLFNIGYGSGKTCTVFQFDQTVILKKQKALASLVVSFGTATESPSATSSRLVFVPG